MKNFLNFFINLIKNHFLLILITSLLIGAGVFFGRQYFVLGASPQNSYQTEKVKKGTLVSAISASGQVVSANSMPVTTPLTGIIKNVFVKNGDTVEAEQKIMEVTLDSTSQQKNSQAWSSYLTAKNNVDTAKAAQYSLQSTMIIAEQKFINDAQTKGLAATDPTYIQENADKLAAEAKYNNQSSIIDQAQAAANNAWLAYQATNPVITAPIGGKVSDLVLIPGMVINSGSTGTGGTSASSQKVAAILTDGNPVASFNLSEIDVNKVKSGQKATINLDALSGKTFTGKVLNVDHTGTINSGVTTYPVTIQFDTGPDGILPNMAGNVNIIIESKDNVLLAPSNAVQTVGDQSTVRILKDNQVQTVPVTTGSSSDTQTEIVSGLSEGEEIITAIVSKSSSNNSGSPFGGLNLGGSFGGAGMRAGGLGVNTRGNGR